MVAQATLLQALEAVLWLTRASESPPGRSSAAGVAAARSAASAAGPRWIPASEWLLDTAWGRAPEPPALAAPALRAAARAAPAASPREPWSPAPAGRSLARVMGTSLQHRPTTSW